MATTFTALPAEPAAGAAWTSLGNAHYTRSGQMATAINGAEARLDAVIAAGGHPLDTFTGATDDLKLTAALSYQAAQTGRPPIILGARNHDFNTVRTPYSGLRIIGPRSGQKNMELGGSSDYVPARVTLGASLSSGTSSWWVGTGTYYDIYMSSFGVSGDGGSSKHQFWDQTTGTLYACEFNSLAFDMMRGVFGTSTRKCLCTQVMFTGSWTVNNCWDTPFHIGGSDVTMWLDSVNNIGVSSSSAQTGTLTRYFMILDSLEADIGKAYISAMNGWRGVLISGNSNITMHGGVYEGYKSTRQNGLLSGPAPGSLIKITGGATTMHGTKIGQGLDNPDATETGLVWITGGEVSMFGVNFYGANMDGVDKNAIKHTGGRLGVFGAVKRQGEAWAGRPRISTTATAGTGTYTYSCPDQSLQAP